MKHAYFDCDCDSTEHTIRFSWFEDEEEDPCVYMETTLHQYRSFWRRCLVAVRYVFGYECKYGHWDCTSLTKQQCWDLGKFLMNRGALR